MWLKRSLNNRAIDAGITTAEITIVTRVFAAAIAHNIAHNIRDGGYCRHHQGLAFCLTFIGTGDRS